MPCSNSGRQRWRSMSSMRSRKRPPTERADFPGDQRRVGVADVQVARRRRREPGDRRRLAGLGQRQEVGALGHGAAHRYAMETCDRQRGDHCRSARRLTRRGGGFSARRMECPCPCSPGPACRHRAGGPPRQLVVLLHGVGADGDDLIELAPALRGVAAGCGVRRARTRPNRTTWRRSATSGSRCATGGPRRCCSASRRRRRCSTRSSMPSSSATGSPIISSHCSGSPRAP